MEILKKTPPTFAVRDDAVIGRVMKLRVAVRNSMIVGISCIYFGSAAMAQSTFGSFVGTVRDPSGAVVANASVQVTNKGTSAQKSATTDAAGSYSVVNVEPGTRDQYLDSLSNGMARLENGSGHLFQSAAQSSIDTWTSGGRGGGSGDENAVNTTISYYSKGSALGPVLDFAIRYATNNQKSLDTVMRTLYKEFYQEKKRGFTDEEFREVCERTAGTSLAELFEDYVYSTKDVNFAKYFEYAGLKLDTELRTRPGAYLGADMANNGTTISRVEVDSPARAGGLSAQDQVLAVDEVPIGNRKLDDIVKTKKSGDAMKLLVARANRIEEVNVVLGVKMERSFKITLVDNPTPLQAAIPQDWLKN